MTEVENALSQVDSIKELLGYLEFDGIQFLEQHAKSSFEQLKYELEDDDAEIEPEIDIELHTSSDAIVLRVIFKAETSAGEVLIDGLVNFTSTRPINISRKLAQEYVNKVGFGTYVPYLRQAVHDITAKCFSHPLILPFFNSEVFEFSEEEERDDEESSSSTP